jgi:hypothetical protein
LQLSRRLTQTHTLAPIDEEMSMRRRLHLPLLPIAGTVASALAATWAVSGFALYGSEMTPNLLAELAGVSLEVAVAALVIHGVMSRYQRRQWDFAYQALADRVAESFVDVMRLLSVRLTTEALVVNGDRYGLFVTTAQEHLADLRSHIEGASTALDPRTHQLCRKIERRLAWCLAQLRTRPETADRPAKVWQECRVAAAMGFELIHRDGEGHVVELATARDAVAAAADIDDFVRRRLTAQSLLLDALRDVRPDIGSIGLDIDHDYAISYFLIDCLLQDVVPLQPASK